MSDGVFAEDAHGGDDGGRHDIVSSGMGRSHVGEAARSAASCEVPRCAQVGSSCDRSHVVQVPHDAQQKRPNLSVVGRRVRVPSVPTTAFQNASTAENHRT